MIRSRIGIGLLLLAVVTAGLGGVHRHRTRAKTVPALPNHDYQWGSRSPSETGLSFESTPLFPSRLAPPAALADTLEVETIAPNRNFRYFPSKSARIDIGHCGIADLAVVMDVDGNWTLSLRGAQNPTEEPSGERLIEYPDSRRLAQKRNQFWVRIRAVGGTATASPDSPVRHGGAVLFTIDTKPFWVESGLPAMVTQRDHSDLVGRYINDIDHLEVEFWYR